MLIELPEGVRGRSTGPIGRGTSCSRSMASLSARVMRSCRPAFKREDKPLTLKFVREQQAKELVIARHAWVQLETAKTADAFTQLPVPARRPAALSSSVRDNVTIRSTLWWTGNSPLVTARSSRTASRKASTRWIWGARRAVSAISSWSCQHGKRGVQRLTLYGSATEKDPGWDTAGTDAAWQHRHSW